MPECARNNRLLLFYYNLFFNHEGFDPLWLNFHLPLKISESSQCLDEVNIKCGLTDLTFFYLKKQKKRSHLSGW